MFRYKIRLVCRIRLTDKLLYKQAKHAWREFTNELQRSGAEHCDRYWFHVFLYKSKIMIMVMK